MKGWLGDPGQLRRRLFRYDGVELVTSDLDHLSKPFPTALVLRLLSRGSCFAERRSRRVACASGRAQLARYGWRFASDSPACRCCSARARRRVRALAAAPTRGGVAHARPRASAALPPQRPGAGRARGWLGRPRRRCRQQPRRVRRAARLRDERPDPDGPPRRRNPRRAAGSGVLRVRGGTAPALQRARSSGGHSRHSTGDTPAFVYHRYGLYSYAGLALARRLGVPFVLEYNGSEVWISRNWGRPLRFQAVAAGRSRRRSCARPTSSSSSAGRSATSSSRSASRRRRSS